jgi:glycosyltransferase involved in cell wall biosynthesis
MALASYPVEAAATRYRLEQYVAPLAERGIRMTIHPFLDAQLFAHFYQRKSFPKTVLGLFKSSIGRIADLLTARNADLILVQREAMMFGPPLFEWFTTRAMKRPMVLDLDDATYIPYTSPTYGGVAKSLKWVGKTDDLMRWAKIVICGNSSIAAYASSKGAQVRIIPTVVDTDLFRPANRSTVESEVVLGWIGTHSTFPYLQLVFPALAELGKRHRIRLRIVGAGRDNVTIPGVTVENLPWRLEREVHDFQSLDIGLYPIDETLYSGWAAGKSGFKAIQYMAIGVPYVATPIGGSAEIGEVGTTHLFAETPDEWQRALEELILDPERRRMMGQAGREHVLKHYGLQDQADKFADVLRAAGQLS